mmetsp:Transcript_68839/g.128479  ORF Transcript_68839/g.128479 Transcript_68839/m.128479 type:complete len:219 (+) Transcript_68839:28-684(+)
MALLREGVAQAVHAASSSAGSPRRDALNEASLRARLPPYSTRCSPDERVQYGLDCRQEGSEATSRWSPRSPSLLDWNPQLHEQAAFQASSLASSIDASSESQHSSSSDVSPQESSYSRLPGVSPMGFPLQALEAPVGPTPNAITPLLVEVLRELSLATEELLEKDPPAGRLIEVLALAHWACQSLKRLEDECNDRVASVAAWSHSPQLPVLLNQPPLR